MNRRKFLQISAAAGAAAAAPALAMEPATEVAFTNPTAMSLGPLECGGTYDVSVAWDVVAQGERLHVTATATTVEIDPDKPQSPFAMLKFENGKAKIEKVPLDA